MRTNNKFCSLLADLLIPTIWQRRCFHCTNLAIRLPDYRLQNKVWRSQGVSNSHSLWLQLGTHMQNPLFH